MDNHLHFIFGDIVEDVDLLINYLEDHDEYMKILIQSKINVFDNLNSFDLPDNLINQLEAEIDDNIMSYFETIREDFEFYCDNQKSSSEEEDENINESDSDSD